MLNGMICHGKWDVMLREMEIVHVTGEEIWKQVLMGFIGGVFKGCYGKLKFWLRIAGLSFLNFSSVSIEVIFFNQLFM
jgi:hypothetical protein